MGVEIYTRDGLASGSIWHQIDPNKRQKLVAFKVGQVGLLQMLEGQHESHEDQPVLGAAHVRLPSQELRPPKD